MAKYRKKPVVVEATQWFPGVAVPGVTEKGTEIHYSDDGRLYYVTRGNDRPTHWLSTEAIDGPVPDDKRQEGNFFSPQWAQFSLGDGRTYHRKALPFSNWKVQDRSGKVEPLSENTDLFKDYASLMEWPAQRTPLAHVTTIHKERATITSGDWIIAEPDSEHFYPCKPDIFAATYEPVEQTGQSEVPHFVTARTYPLGDDGKFQSEPAEFAHQVAARFGLNRDQTRAIIQAFVVKGDECRRQYEAWVEANRPRGEN